MLESKKENVNQKIVTEFRQVMDKEFLLLKEEAKFAENEIMRLKDTIKKV